MSNIKHGTFAKTLPLKYFSAQNTFSNPKIYVFVRAEVISFVRGAYQEYRGSVDTSGWCQMIHSFRNVRQNLKYVTRLWAEEFFAFNPKDRNRIHWHTGTCSCQCGKMKWRADLIWLLICHTDKLRLDSFREGMVKNYSSLGLVGYNIQWDIKWRGPKNGTKLQI